MKKHLIIDGNNLVHRAFWISNNNANANHIFITLRSLKSYVEQFNPDKIWCAWDMRLSKEPALRKQMNEEYKQTRDNDYNQQVHEQTDLIVDFFEKLGIKNIYPTRGEADDIIFWLTRELSGKKVVISADTDFFQLISDDTSVYSPIKKVLYNVDAFYEKFGFYPDKYALYKSIVGDKADNIVGLDRVGLKRAIKLLENLDKLDESQLDKVKSNLQLVDLNNTGDPDWDNEYSTYQKQLDDKISADFTVFLEMCENQRFHSIINQQSQWYNAFCIKSTMDNIITKLFSS